MEKGEALGTNLKTHEWWTMLPPGYRGIPYFFLLIYIYTFNYGKLEPHRSEERRVGKEC